MSSSSVILSNLATKCCLKMSAGKQGDSRSIHLIVSCCCFYFAFYACHAAYILSIYQNINCYIKVFLFLFCGTVCILRLCDLPMSPLPQQWCLLFKKHYKHYACLDFFICLHTMTTEAMSQSASSSMTCTIGLISKCFNNLILTPV